MSRARASNNNDWAAAGCGAIRRQDDRIGSRQARLPSLIGHVRLRARRAGRERSVRAALTKRPDQLPQRTAEYDMSFVQRWVAPTIRIVPDFERITRLWVLAPSPQ